VGGLVGCTSWRPNSLSRVVVFTQERFRLLSEVRLRIRSYTIDSMLMQELGSSEEDAICQQFAQFALGTHLCRRRTDSFTMQGMSRNPSIHRELNFDA
jgi:hypothetical protein